MAAAMSPRSSRARSCSCPWTWSCGEPRRCTTRRPLPTRATWSGRRRCSALACACAGAPARSRTACSVPARVWGPVRAMRGWASISRCSAPRVSATVGASRISTSRRPASRAPAARRAGTRTASPMRSPARGPPAWRPPLGRRARRVTTRSLEEPCRSSPSRRWCMRAFAPALRPGCSARPPPSASRATTWSGRSGSTGTP
mmetsp:Transcript_60489/g.167370  ORF Transcript_60489/g.167370 Transcript_60489/m.167370 type:complete len:201 (+) Transcript_60489:30-632(+)